MDKALTPSSGGTLTVLETGTAWHQTSGSGSGLVGLGTTTVTGSDQYTLTETGTVPAGPVAIAVAGLESGQTVTTVSARTGATQQTTSGADQFDRTLSGSTDSGTLSWSSGTGGSRSVGGLSFSPAGDSRYNLIEDFVPGTDVTGTGAGDTTFSPSGAAYGESGPGNDGGIGGSFGGLSDVSGANGAPAAGVLDASGQLGRVWGGAGQPAAEGGGGVDLLAYAPVLGAEVFQKYCFAAGTPLRTPDGFKNVEDFRPGDRVLSRDEWDPTGAVEAKVVEEVFTGTAGVVDVHVGGEVIRTTVEHRFWVRGRGWTAVADFEPGCELVGHDGQRTRVGRVAAVDGLVAVYNMRIADHHTYFVGCTEWGWNAWAHNTCTSPEPNPPQESDSGHAGGSGDNGALAHSGQSEPKALEEMNQEELEAHVKQRAEELRGVFVETNPEGEKGTTLSVGVVEKGGDPSTRKVVVTTSADSQTFPAAVKKNIEEHGEEPRVTEPTIGRSDSRDNPGYNPEAAAQRQQENKRPDSRNNPKTVTDPVIIDPVTGEEKPYTKAVNGEPVEGTLHHAEQRMENEAKSRGEVVLAQQPTKPCCAGCTKVLGESGGLSKIPSPGGLD